MENFHGRVRPTRGMIFIWHNFYVTPPSSTAECFPLTCDLMDDFSLQLISTFYAWALFNPFQPSVAF